MELQAIFAGGKLGRGFSSNFANLDDPAAGRDMLGNQLLWQGVNINING